MNPGQLAIYGSMIDTALYVMVLMQAIHYERGGWALEIKNFLGPVKRHRAIRRVPFGAQKSQDFQGPTPSQFLK